MYYQEREEGKWRAAVEAALILLFCFFAVVYSGKLSWQSAPPPALAVTLIPALRPPAPPPPPPEPPQEIAPKELPPVDAEVVRAREEKRKAEEKKREEKKRKEEEEKRKKEEREKKKREEEQARKKEEEKRQAAAEEARQQAAEAAAAAAEKSAYQNRLDRRRGEIIGYIQTRIKKNLNHLTAERIRKCVEKNLKTPRSVPLNEIVVVIQVQLTPKGELKDLPEIIESSGCPEYDESAVRAVLKSAPLPIPTDKFILDNADFFSGFLEHKLYITPVF